MSALGLRREEELRHFFQGRNAEQTAIAADDGDAPEMVGEHVAIYGEKRFISRCGDDLTPTDGGGGGPHVHDELGLSYTRAIQHPIGSGIDFSAAGRLCVNTSNISEISRVADRRTNGVGVRVLMPDDVNGVHDGSGFWKWIVWA